MMSDTIHLFLAATFTGYAEVEIPGSVPEIDWADHIKDTLDRHSWSVDRDTLKEPRIVSAENDEGRVLSDAVHYVDGIPEFNKLVEEALAQQEILLEDLEDRCVVAIDERAACKTRIDVLEAVNQALNGNMAALLELAIPKATTA